MNKQKILEKIQLRIAQEAENLKRGALHAHRYATDSESKAEDKYDTRGLEASYLAEGQAKLAAESAIALATYKALPLKEFAAGEVIALTALVELECGGERKCYFIGPKSGGITIEHDGPPITLITPTSPLGQVLMGKQEGDSVEVITGRVVREYEIISVC